jgi:hypothetical protein
MGTETQSENLAPAAVDRSSVQDLALPATAMSTEPEIKNATTAPAAPAAPAAPTVTNIEDAEGFRDMAGDERRHLISLLEPALKNAEDDYANKPEKREMTKATLTWLRPLVADLVKEQADDKAGAGIGGKNGSNFSICRNMLQQK